MKRYNEIIKDLSEEFLVEDIIGEDAKVVFILESPHVQELKYEAPVSGSSGKSMTKKIFKEEYDLPLGRLLKEKINNGNEKEFKRIGLMNVCQIPMQEKAYNDESLIEKYKTFFHSLEKVRTANQKKVFKDESLQSLQNEILDAFKSKLERFKDRNLTLVPCGRFAQKFFELADIESDKWVVIDNVPHPSYNSWSKGKYKDAIEKVVNACK